MNTLARTYTVQDREITDMLNDVRNGGKFKSYFDFVEEKAKKEFGENLVRVEVKRGDYVPCQAKFECSVTTFFAQSPLQKP